jgi:hypothetical protein
MIIVVCWEMSCETHTPSLAYCHVGKLKASMDEWTELLFQKLLQLKWQILGILYVVFYTIPVLGPRLVFGHTYLLHTKQFRIFRGTLLGSFKSTFISGLPLNGKCYGCSAPEFAHTSGCMLLLSWYFCFIRASLVSMGWTAEGLKFKSW